MVGIVFRMAEEVVIKKTNCPNGHRLNLHVLANTPNLIQVITCPRCGIKKVGLVSQLVSVELDDSAT